MFSTFYTLDIIKEVSKAAIKYNVDLLVETEGQLSGLSGILFADYMGNEALIKKASRKRIPYIVLNYYVRPAPCHYGLLFTSVTGVVGC